jgi:hypothetical protein
MGIIDNFLAWYDSTHVHEQILEVDFVGLFTNPWFIIPFGILLAWMLYKQQWRDIIIITALVGIWWFSGTDYMHTLIVDGEIQIEKILPLIFGGAAVVGFIIYLLFGRSD